MKEKSGEKAVVKCANCNKVIKGNCIFVIRSDNTKGYDFLCANCNLHKKNESRSKFY